MFGACIVLDDQSILSLANYQGAESPVWLRHNNKRNIPTLLCDS